MRLATLQWTTFSLLLIVACGRAQESDDPIETDAASATGSCGQVASVAAASMPTKTQGNACWPGCWNLWNNGYIEETFTFSADGTYDFVIHAQGMLAQGVGPNMELRIDGQKVAAKILSAALSNTTFTEAVTAGAHRVAIAFTNNLDTRYEQRNLLIDRLTINCDSRTTTPPVQPPTQPPTQPTQPTGNMQSAIAQNTVGGSAVFAYGVPTSYSWYKGKDIQPGTQTPPAGFTAITGWGVVYPQNGAAQSPANARFELTNFKTYVHKKSGGWILVQEVGAGGAFGGAQFDAAFAGPSKAWSASTSGNVLSVGAPTPGWNAHYWVDPRGTYTTADIDGAFVRVDGRATDAADNLVMQLGVDWWRNASAGYVDGFSNNQSPGTSNWVKLSTDWQSWYYYSLPTAAFQADPPPLD